MPSLTWVITASPMLSWAEVSTLGSHGTVAMGLAHTLLAKALLVRLVPSALPGVWHQAEAELVA